MAAPTRRKLTPPPQRPRATAFSSGIVLRPRGRLDSEATLELDPEDQTLDHEQATTPQRMEAPRKMTMVPPAFTPQPVPPSPSSNPFLSESTASVWDAHPTLSAPLAPSSQPVLTMAANDAGPYPIAQGAMTSAADIPTVRPPRPDKPIHANPMIGWLLLGVAIGAVGVFVPMSMRDVPQAPSMPATVYVPIASPPAATPDHKATPAAQAAPKDALPIPTVSADDLPKTRRRR